VEVPGLDAAGLNATVGVSSLTLGGILKHLAYVEDYWFSQRLLGATGGPPLDTWTGPRTRTGTGTSPRLREHPGAAPRDLAGRRGPLPHLGRRGLGPGWLGRAGRRPWPNGESPSLRWIVVHMIEEYARHNGHADLLRESIDGETGE
jgi:hypothetical protein